MNKNIKKIISLVLLLPIIFIILIIAAYYYCNLVFIPRTIIPEIKKQVSAQLHQNITIKSITLSPAGTIKILRPALYDKTNTAVFIECKSILAAPSYRDIYRAWRKKKNKIDIPLRINVNEAAITQNPLDIHGSAVADMLITLNLSDKNDIDYRGTVSLEKWVINGIPFFSSINDISGTVAITPESVSSSDIRGIVNNMPAAMSFSINEFKSPRIALHAELSPLEVDVNCAIKNDDLNIENISLSYKKINCSVQGKIKSIQQAPFAEISASAELDLAALSSLPLKERELISRFSPAGVLTAKLQLSGPLQNTQNINAGITLNSPGISILNYPIKDILLQASIKNGVLNLENFTVSVMESILKAQAKVGIWDKNLACKAVIDISNLLFENIKNTFKLPVDIYGAADTHIIFKGNLSTPDNLEVEFNSVLKNTAYYAFALPPAINASGTINVKGLKDIIIKNLAINDSAAFLNISGNIYNIYSPALELSGSFDCPLENLKNYKAIPLPETIILKGAPHITFKISGSPAALDAMKINVEASADDLSINRFSLQQIGLKGFFKEMQLNISSLSAKLYAGELSAAGIIDLKNMAKPVFNLNASINSVDVQTFLKNTQIAPINLTGSFSSQIRLNGSGNTPQTFKANADLTADLENGVLDNIPLETVHAGCAAEYINTDVTLKNFSFAYKSIELSAKGRVISIPASPQMEITANSNLDLSDISKLPIPAMSALEQLKLSGSISAQTKINGPMLDWKSWTAVGRIASEKIGIKDVMFENVDLNANLDNHLLVINLSSQAYDGEIKAKADADILTDSVTYKANAEIKKIDIGRLIKESKIINQPHQGILSFNADINGTGTSLNTLGGKADFQLSEARLYGIQFLKVIGSIANIEFLENFEVTHGNGDFEINNGLISTRNTQLTGPSAITYIKGGVEIITQRFEDFIVSLILTQEGASRTRSGVLNNFFIYKDNVYQRDIHVKGTLAKPEIDKEKLMRDLANQQIVQGINKLLDKKTGQPSEKDTSQAPDTAKEQLQKGVEQILEKGLKGLFGK
ncbi:MAG: AsmA family protein [Candidatus Omnitrophica bacterium]|nr:AsmA family protein [Candidatus Omnitrophota bacterium]MBU4479072.1 AsmA family protein [Candidatus Omnitrophota bacterium]